jgi:Ras family protein A
MSSVERKLVVIGDGACGKTCLLIVKAQGKFPEDYVPTVFENYITKLKVDDQDYELTLWDTAGQEDYAHIRPLSYEGAQIFLICFSVDNMDSFENIPVKWIPEMKRYCPQTPFLLVGCKGDIRKEGKAVVSKEQADELAAKTDNCKGYMECSARTGEGIDELFVTATRSAISGSKSGGCCVLM